MKAPFQNPKIAPEAALSAAEESIKALMGNFSSKEEVEPYLEHTLEPIRYFAAWRYLEFLRFEWQELENYESLICKKCGTLKQVFAEPDMPDMCPYCDIKEILARNLPNDQEYLSRRNGRRLK